MTGGNIRAWLLLLSPGRYRLLSDEQIQNNPRLDCVRSLILEGKPAIETELTYAEQTHDEAIVARLVPINLTHHKQSQSWRFLFPKEMIVLSSDCDVKNLSILLSLEGYWEIWYTDVLRKTLSIPLREQR